MKRLDEEDADEDRTTGGGAGKLAEKIAAIQSKRDRHKRCSPNWIAPVLTRSR